jgi:hypothetical protein
MKILPNMSFKALAAAGAVAMLVSTAYAATYQQCQPSCTQIAQNYYNSAKTSFTTQQTNYCNGLTDPSAKSACLAGVPAYAEQQAQNVYTQAYNACMQGCTGV